MTKDILEYTNSTFQLKSKAKTNFYNFGCYRNFANSKKMIKNVCMWVNMIILISTITLIILFIDMHMKTIYSSLNIFVANPQPNQLAIYDISSNSSKKEDSFKDYVSSEDVSTKQVEKIVHSHQGSETNLNIVTNNELTHQATEPKTTLDNTIQVNEEKVSEHTSEHKEIKKNNLYYEVLNVLEYEDAIEEDKRTFLHTIRDIFFDKEYIITLFAPRSPFFNRLTLKFITLSYLISTMFFINGLLYTESRIRDRYNYQKDINVSYLFTHYILYCFISTVV